MNGRGQESTGVEQAKTIAKERGLEVEEEDKILAKKVGKSRVHHALRPSNFYSLIGQNLTGEFMQKIYIAS